MEDKEITTSRESLRLIEEMIGKAKADYRETGVSALLWGSVIIFCSLVTLLNASLQLPLLRQVWLLTLIAVVPQLIISTQEKKKQPFSRHTDSAIGSIWTAFGISVGLLSYYSAVHGPASGASVYLVLYGIPTFATGITYRFTPMVIGGVVCWLCAIISFYTPFYTDVVLTAVAAFFAWLLPGILLRIRYLKAKRSNV